MTSRTISFLLLSLTMLVLAACGSDDPTFPDQRTLTTKQLAHVVKGGTPQVNKVDFRFSFDTRALTASVQLGSIDAGPTTISGLTLALDEDENRYEIKPGAGTDARVSGLHGIYDPNEGVVWLDYVVDGNTAVHLTPTSLFYMNNTTTVGVEGNQTNAAGAIFQFEIDPETMLATAWVMQLPDTKNSRFYNVVSNDIDLIKQLVQGKDPDQSEFINNLLRNHENKFFVTLTPTGYTIAGEDLQAATNYRAHTGSDQTEQRTLNYKFASLNFALNVAAASMTGQFTLSNGLTATVKGNVY